MTEPTREEVNAFLRVKTGIHNSHECKHFSGGWDKTAKSVFPMCLLTKTRCVENNCKDFNGTKVDFFTPDGMVRLMEWLKENGYEMLMQSIFYQNKWSVAIAASSGIEVRKFTEIADTHQSALAMAAYRALKGADDGTD